MLIEFKLLDIIIDIYFLSFLALLFIESFYFQKLNYTYVSSSSLINLSESPSISLLL